MTKIFLLLSLSFLQLISNSQNIIAPTGLTVELLRAPDKAVITDPEPEFGWIFPQTEIAQTAFQILVASSPEFLNTEKGDLWESGKTLSNRSINVSYKGKKLHPDSEYWWKVKVWGADGKDTEYSRAQHFYTGKFNRASDKWAGQSNWIESDNGNWVAENRQMATFVPVKPIIFE
jgi:hypothetical protein